jgi:hypothetical protein
MEQARDRVRESIADAQRRNLARYTDAELVQKALYAEEQSRCAGYSDARMAEAAGHSAVLYRNEIQRRQRVAAAGETA